jgi:hypothetical protein
MPLGVFEREVLRCIAVNRNPDSFVAGANVIHQAPDSPRASQDVDVFHDAPEKLAASVTADLAALDAAGFETAKTKEDEFFVRAQVARAGHSTKIEWVLDSAFRFFPVEPDVELGWRLNFWDAATNKTLALCARAKLRDMLDSLFLHEHHLHVGALVWAAAGKDPGLSPEMIIHYARRFAIYRESDVRDLQLSQPVDLRDLKVRWMEASQEALELFPRLPASELGCLYLDARGCPVCPEPDSPAFPKLKRHFGSLFGALPRIVED